MKDYIETALELLQERDGEVTSEIIRDLIKEHAPERQRMVDLYERYKASKAGVPVLTRQFTDKKKINNKLNNDFFGEIIDTKVGYFAGEPITYSVDEEAEQQDIKQEVIDQFKRRNYLPDLDAETVKLAAVCGIAGRLAYIDREGMEKVMNVDPWECIFITDMSINEPQYSMRYYKVTVQTNEVVSPQGHRKQEERWRVEWYDDTYVYYFIEQKTGEFLLDPDEPPREHMFDYVPLIGFPNNEEHQGDAEKVLPLIDGYDRTMSDVNSEIEQFRLAYMYFKGVNLDPYEDEDGRVIDPVEKMRQTGGFEVPEDGEVGFITKELQDQIVENHLDRLEKLIYRFSQTPNFQDEAFAGSQSGIARKYKMLPFENKCITMERKFTAALQQMFKVVGSAWQKKGIPFDYSDMDFVFTRNFPQDMLHEAEVAEKLRGQVSEKTRLSQLSFVDDVDAEIKAMQEEMSEVDLDAPVEDEEE